MATFKATIERAFVASADVASRAAANMDWATNFLIESFVISPESSGYDARISDGDSKLIEVGEGDM